MLFEAGQPRQNPALLQARLTAVTALLEERTRAVERLQGERDALRTECDTFRTERDTANAEVEKLQLIIKALMRSRYGACSEKLDPDQLQLALEEVAQSLGAAQAVVDPEAPADGKATGSASRRSATAAPCRRICRGSRSSSMSRTSAARVAAVPCMSSARTSPRCWTLFRRSTRSK